MTDIARGTAGRHENLEKEVATLDREARRSLDRLADKREELERRHRETDLAARRQREREQERLAQEAREAEGRQQRQLVEEAERLGRRRLELEERAEREASALAAKARPLSLDPAANAPAQWVSMTFHQVLFGWFLGRFGGTRGLFPGIGHDVRDGLGLVERDALTPPAGRASGSAEGDTPRSR